MKNFSKKTWQLGNPNFVVYLKIFCLFLKIFIYTFNKIIVKRHVNFFIHSPCLGIITNPIASPSETTALSAMRIIKLINQQLDQNTEIMRYSMAKLADNFSQVIFNLFIAQCSKKILFFQLHQKYSRLNIGINKFFLARILVQARAT